MPVLVLVSVLASAVSAGRALQGRDLQQLSVPAGGRGGGATDEASADGAAAWARIERAADSAVRGARHAAELEMDALKTLLAQAQSINPDPADPRTEKIMGAFMSLYSRFTAPGLAAVSSADEREYAREFFAGFFTPEDNRAQDVKTLSGYLSGLAQHRTRRDYNYKVGTMTDGGNLAMAKGGEMLVLAGEYADRQRDEAAAVLAHEMTHNEKRHFIQYRIMRSVNELLLSETGAPAAKTAAALAANYYEWLCEYQADAGALKLLRLAGFNPRGLAAVLEKLPPWPRTNIRAFKRNKPMRK